MANYEVGGDFSERLDALCSEIAEAGFDAIARRGTAEDARMSRYVPAERLASVRLGCIYYLAHQVALDEGVPMGARQTAAAIFYALRKHYNLETIQKLG